MSASLSLRAAPGAAPAARPSRRAASAFSAAPAAAAPAARRAGAACRASPSGGAEPAPASAPAPRRAALAALAAALGAAAAAPRRADADEAPAAAAAPLSKFEPMASLKGKDYGKSRMTYSDFTTTASGLQISDVKLGAGELPKKGQTVVVDWTGYTIGYYGRPFEARNKPKGSSFSDDKKEFYRFPLGTGVVIPAWEEAIAGMRPGGIRRIIVPQELARAGRPRPPARPPARRHLAPPSASAHRPHARIAALFVCLFCLLLNPSPPQNHPLTPGLPRQRLPQAGP